jgi:hypothetical protein
MTTRAQLYASVKFELNRQDRDQFFDEWLASAEFRINKLLRAREMIQRATVVITETLFPLPSDFIAIDSVGLRIAGANQNDIGRRAGTLRYIPIDAINSGSAELPYPGTTPGWFTVRGREIELGPWNNSAANYQIDLSYFANLPKLIANDSTNWLLTQAPHIYRNAMLHFGFNSLMEYDTAGAMMTNVITEIQMMNDAAEAEKMAAGPLIMARPARKMGGRNS